MLGLLLKNRLKIIFLEFTRDEPKKRVGRIIGTLIAVVIFSMILYYSARLISFIYGSLGKALASTIMGIALDYGFFIVFIFILFTGVATTLYILYSSKDLELLLSLPVSYRTVFTYKYIEALITNSYLFFITVLPFLIAYGITSAVPVLYYPVMLMVFISIISLPTSLGVLTGMIVARYINPAKAREMIAIIGGFIGISIWLSSQFLSRYVGNLPPEIKMMDTENIKQYIIVVFDKPFLRILPSGWGSKSIFFLHSGIYDRFSLNFVLITATSGILVFICIMLSQRIYYTGWSGASQAAGRRIKKEGQREVKKAGEEKYGLKFFSGINYLLIKEFKIMIRDTRKLIQILMPFVMFVFIFFWSMSGQTGNGEINFFIGIETIIFLFFPLLVAGMINVNLSGNNIGGEGLNFWILLTSPVSSRRILRTKIIFSSCITALIGSIIMLVLYIIYKPGILNLITGILLLILFSWGDSTICTSTGAFFPLFKPSQSQKNNVSFTGSLLILLFFAVYIIFFGGIIIGMLFVASLLNWPQFTGYAVIIIIEVLLNVVLYNILINISVYRLNSMEWKY